MGDAVFEALWKNVLDEWDEERPHRTFLELCEATDQLAEAAARYRGMKGDRERSGVAEQRLAFIAMVALAKLETTRSKPPRTRRASHWLLAVSFGLAAIGLLAYLLTSR